MKFLFTAILMILFCPLFGQINSNVDNTVIAHQTNYSINAGGGEALSQQGNYSYSIGQIFAAQVFKVEGQVDSGVQQGVYDYKQSENEGVSLTVYPNPVVDILSLSVDNLIFENINYQIYNLEGKLMKENEVKEEMTEIVLNFLQDGIYILLLNNGNEFITSVKIIKI